MVRKFTLEKDLIDQLRLHDTDAFEELYNRYWYSLYSYCLKKLNSPTSSKDIVRDIFIDIWEKRESLPVDFSLSKHLYDRVRKDVVNRLNSNSVEAEGQAWIEKNVIPGFTVDALMSAREPVTIQGWERHTIPLPNRTETKKGWSIPYPSISQLKWLVHLIPSKS